ncbi:cation:proton antiporter [Lacisediminihabitans sp.]|uniref:cation:proton antiporter n=1 Tax=Lacisediminihabitans sp. TaxID=2787631 RepID=UPI00374D4FBC
MDVASVAVFATASVVAVLVVSGIGSRFHLPTPLLLVLAGGLGSLLPALSTFELQPDLILYAVLPPLLYAAAVRTPLADIRASGDSIALLSIYLVTCTVALMGLVSWWLVPGLSLAAALAFGAIVAPTDAVAVSALAGRSRLPRRIVEVLEAESLLNDATALVALNAAIAALAITVKPLDIAANFLFVVAVGLAVGIAVGLTVAAVRKRVRSSTLDTGLALTVPFLAFLPAEALGGSGILAVVTAGLLLGERAPRSQTLEARIAEATIWRTVRFLLENAVFFLIGLSVSGLVRRLAETHIAVWTVIGLSAVVLAALAAIRFANVMATVAVYRFGPARLRNRSWTWGTGVVVSSAGMRGVVTLAAAFLLPAETPQRELLQFLALVVVVGTLLEGLALPTIVRWARIDAEGPLDSEDERQQLQSEIRNAGLRRLSEEVIPSELEAARQRLEVEITTEASATAVDTDLTRSSLDRASLALRLRMLESQRVAVFEARSAGRYRASITRTALAMLDVEEAAARRATLD